MRSEAMKNLQYYLELPYTVIMRRDEDGDYVARIDELPGCAAHGETQAQALEALEEAKELWITDCLESGDPVPEPEPDEPLPSGKWVQRVPRTLHKKLVSLAKRENVSLNQLVASILAEAVGSRRAAPPGHMVQELLAGRNTSWHQWDSSPGDRLALDVDVSGHWVIRHDASRPRMLRTALGMLCRGIPNEINEIIVAGEELRDAHQEPVSR
jgi:antitoxin HicB